MTIASGLRRRTTATNRILNPSSTLYNAIKSNSVIGRVRCKRITHSPFTSALRVLCPDAEFEFLYTTFVDFATSLFAVGLKLELLFLWRYRMWCLRFRVDRSIEVLQPAMSLLRNVCVRRCTQSQAMTRDSAEQCHREHQVEAHLSVLFRLNRRFIRAPSSASSSILLPINLDSGANSAYLDSQGGILTSQLL